MLQHVYFASLAEKCRLLRADPEYVARYSQFPDDGRLLVNMFEGDYSMEAIIDFFGWRFHTGPDPQLTVEDREKAAVHFLQLLPAVRKALDSE